MTRTRSSIEVRDECPYCGYRFSIDGRDICGELHALRCLDCKQKFVVEIIVEVSHKIDGIVGVESDDVLDRITEKIADGTESGEPTFIVTGASDEAGPGDQASVDTTSFREGLEAISAAGAAVAAHVGKSICETARAGADLGHEQHAGETLEFNHGDTPPVQEITPEEISELSKLLRDDPSETPAGDADYVAEKERPQDPARAHSGINTRPPPSMASLGRGASAKGGGLKLSDRK